MGHRANLILVQEDGYQLFYCHWCANTLPNDLFWGPASALPFIARQHAVDADDWLDETWAEGGVIVDPTRHTLLLYGGDSLLYDIPLRRLYLELLQRLWTGWAIRWAHDGVLDLITYLNLDYATLAQPYLRRQEADLMPPEALEWTEIVGSILFEDGALRFFPLMGTIQSRLETGPALIDTARQTPGFETLSLDDWAGSFPNGGFHVDVAKKLVLFWAAYEPAIAARAAWRWPDWDVHWAKDGFEHQLARTRGLLTYPIASIQERLLRLDETLMRKARTSGPDLILGIAEKERREGASVEINPYAMSEDPQAISYTTRRRLLDDAIEAWRAQMDTTL